MDLPARVWEARHTDKRSRRKLRMVEGEEVEVEVEVEGRVREWRGILKCCGAESLDWVSKC